MNRNAEPIYLKGETKHEFIAPNLTRALYIKHDLNSGDVEITFEHTKVKGESPMKASPVITFPLFLIIIVLCILGLMAVSSVSAQDIEPNPDLRGNINITDIKTVPSIGPNDEVEGVWLWFMLSTTEDNEYCRKDTPQLIISMEIVYEIYVDEYLDAAEWTGEETEWCGNDVYEVLGGRELIDAFADTLEPMAQDSVLPSNLDIGIGGSVGSFQQLMTLIHTKMYAFNKMMCFLPNPESPSGYSWKLCPETPGVAPANVTDIQFHVSEQNKSTYLFIVFNSTVMDCTHKPQVVTTVRVYPKNEIMPYPTTENMAPECGPIDWKSIAVYTEAVAHMWESDERSLPPTSIGMTWAEVNDSIKEYRLLWGRVMCQFSFMHCSFSPVVYKFMEKWQ